MILLFPVSLKENVVLRSACKLLIFYDQVV